MQDIAKPHRHQNTHSNSPWLVGCQSLLPSGIFDSVSNAVLFYSASDIFPIQLNKHLIDRNLSILTASVGEHSGYYEIPLQNSKQIELERQRLGQSYKVFMTPGVCRVKIPVSF